MAQLLERTNTLKHSFTMRTPTVSALVLMVSFTAHAANSLIPEAFPSSRYNAMLEQSPFALATPTAAPAAPTASFASNLVLTGLALMLDAGGVEQPYASLKSRDQTQQFSLFGTEPNNDGIAIVSWELSQEVGKSKVTLRKGNEYGTVEYNQMEIQAPAPAAQAAQAGQGRPAAGNVQMPDPNAGLLPPGGNNPAGVTQRPGGGRVQLPRPQGASGVPGTPGTGPVAGPTPWTRSRVRVIPSRPTAPSAQPPAAQRPPGS